MYKFIDAHKIRRDHPKVLKNFESVNVGDYVQISNGKERFWVEVTNVGQKIEGVVKNYLLDDEQYDYGEKITFKNKNIYEVGSRREIGFL